MGTGPSFGGVWGFRDGEAETLFGEFWGPRDAQDLLSRIGQRWNGASTVLRFRRFTWGHVGVLSNEGVGADALVQNAYAQGYSYDPERVRFGLHISL